MNIIKHIKSSIFVCLSIFTLSSGNNVYASNKNNQANNLQSTMNAQLTKIIKILKDNAANPSADKIITFDFINNKNSVKSLKEFFINQLKESKDLATNIKLVYVFLEQIQTLKIYNQALFDMSGQSLMTLYDEYVKNISKKGGIEESTAKTLLTYALFSIAGNDVIGLNSNCFSRSTKNNKTVGNENLIKKVLSRIQGEQGLYFSVDNGNGWKVAAYIARAASLYRLYTDIGVVYLQASANNKISYIPSNSNLIVDDMELITGIWRNFKTAGKGNVSHITTLKGISYGFIQKCFDKYKVNKNLKSQIFDEALNMQKTAAAEYDKVASDKNVTSTPAPATTAQAASTQSTTPATAPTTSTSTSGSSSGSSSSATTATPTNVVITKNFEAYKASLPANYEKMSLHEKMQYKLNRIIGVLKKFDDKVKPEDVIRFDFIAEDEGIKAIQSMYIEQLKKVKSLPTLIKLIYTFLEQISTQKLGGQPYFEVAGKSWLTLYDEFEKHIILQSNFDEVSAKTLLSYCMFELCADELAEWNKNNYFVDDSKYYRLNEKLRGAILNKIKTEPAMVVNDASISKEQKRLIMASFYARWIGMYRLYANVGTIYQKSFTNEKLLYLAENNPINETEDSRMIENFWENARSPSKITPLKGVSQNDISLFKSKGINEFYSILNKAFSMLKDFATTFDKLLNGGKEVEIMTDNLSLFAQKAENGQLLNLITPLHTKVNNLVAKLENALKKSDLKPEDIIKFDFVTDFDHIKDMRTLYINALQKSTNFKTVVEVITHFIKNLITQKVSGQTVWDISGQSLFTLYDEFAKHLYNAHSFDESSAKTLLMYCIFEIYLSDAMHVAQKCDYALSKTGEAAASLFSNAELLELSDNEYFIRTNQPATTLNTYNIISVTVRGMTFANALMDIGNVYSKIGTNQQIDLYPTQISNPRSFEDAIIANLKASGGALKGIKQSFINSIKTSYTPKKIEDWILTRTKNMQKESADAYNKAAGLSASSLTSHPNYNSYFDNKISFDSNLENAKIDASQKEMFKQIFKNMKEKILERLKITKNPEYLDKIVRTFLKKIQTKQILTVPLNQCSANPIIELFNTYVNSRTELNINSINKDDAYLLIFAYTFNESFNKIVELNFFKNLKTLDNINAFNCNDNTLIDSLITDLKDKDCFLFVDPNLAKRSGEDTVKIMSVISYTMTNYYLLYDAFYLMKGNYQSPIYPTNVEYGKSLASKIANSLKSICGNKNNKVTGMKTLNGSTYSSISSFMTSSWNQTMLYKVVLQKDTLLKEKDDFDKDVDAINKMEVPNTSISNTANTPAATTPATTHTASSVSNSGSSSGSTTQVTTTTPSAATTTTDQNNNAGITNTKAFNDIKNIYEQTNTQLNSVLEKLKALANKSNLSAEDIIKFDFIESDEAIKALKNLYTKQLKTSSNLSDITKLIYNFLNQLKEQKIATQPIFNISGQSLLSLYDSYIANIKDKNKFDEKTVKTFLTYCLFELCIKNVKDLNPKGDFSATSLANSISTAVGNSPLPILSDKDTFNAKNTNKMKISSFVANAMSLYRLYADVGAVYRQAFTKNQILYVTNDKTLSKNDNDLEVLIINYLRTNNGNGTSKTIENTPSIKGLGYVYADKFFSTKINSLINSTLFLPAKNLQKNSAEIFNNGINISSGSGATMESSTPQNNNAGGTANNTTSSSNTATNTYFDSKINFADLINNSSFIKKDQREAFKQLADKLKTIFLNKLKTAKNPEKTAQMVEDFISQIVGKDRIAGLLTYRYSGQSWITLFNDYFEKLPNKGDFDQDAARTYVSYMIFSKNFSVLDVFQNIKTLDDFKKMNTNINTYVDAAFKKIKNNPAVPFTLSDQKIDESKRKVFSFFAETMSFCRIAVDIVSVIKGSFDATPITYIDHKLSEGNENTNPLILGDEGLIDAIIVLLRELCNPSNNLKNTDKITAVKALEGIRYLYINNFSTTCKDAFIKNILSVYSKQD